MVISGRWAVGVPCCARAVVAWLLCCAEGADGLIYLRSRPPSVDTRSAYCADQ